MIEEEATPKKLSKDKNENRSVKCLMNELCQKSPQTGIISTFYGPVNLHNLSLDKYNSDSLTEDYGV